MEQADGRTYVWAFTPARWGVPSAVFSSREKAEVWINQHQASGTLTLYPLDICHYDWCVDDGYFKPKRDDQRTSQFIVNFVSGREHYHYNMDEADSGTDSETKEQ